MKLNLYIPQLDVTLEYEQSWFSSSRLPGKRNIYILKEGNKSQTIQVDERFNTIQLSEIYYQPFEKVRGSIESAYVILDKYNKLKKSNPGYGNYQTTEDYEYEPNKHIFIEEFFDFLKVEFRNDYIDKIIN